MWCHTRWQLFNFFSWLSVAKAGVRRAIQTGRRQGLSDILRAKSNRGEQGTKFSRDFRPIFRAGNFITYPMKLFKLMRQKKYFGRLLSWDTCGQIFKMPWQARRGFSDTKNLFTTFLPSIRRYKLPNKKTRESVQKLKLQICYSMKSVMINQKRFLIWRLSCLK